MQPPLYFKGLSLPQSFKPVILFYLGNLSRIIFYHILDTGLIMVKIIFSPHQQRPQIAHQITADMGILQI